ncbi:hypothetical protein M5689_013749 [Euphorbia peplus]|nr:hypothetical protein M5689_013749 [Euphorbia peplus]
MHLLSRTRTLPLKTLNPLCNFSIYSSLSSSSSSPTQPRHYSKPLHLLFQEAVDLSPNTETSSHVETQSNPLQHKLFELEKEVRDLKTSDLSNSNSIPDQNEKPAKPKSKTLSGLFLAKKLQVDEVKKSDKPKFRRPEEPTVFKEFSEDMRMFLTHLYKEGYFRDANFLPRDKLDFDCFNDSYSRNFIKSAVENFGRDKQDIAKWLSGSDLKKVALFGCPTLGRKNVLSSKRLRQFFGISEDTVCNKCVLKDSCHLVNQSAPTKGSKTLNLVGVMKVLIIYALEVSHPELSVPEEVKAAVSRLLKEILNLSQTTPS